MPPFGPAATPADRPARATLWLAGAALLALTLVGVALHDPGAESVGSVARTNVFVAVWAVAGLAYLAAVRVVAVRRSDGRDLLLVLGVALAVRLAVIGAPPFLSSDLFRYVWDGRVQLAGVNPYRYLPADAALAPLRDAAIFPHINRAATALTIYPPAAQLVFLAVASIAQTALAMKLAMVAFEALAVGAMLAVLRRAGLPPARVVVYAWNPIAVWSFAGNGHVDAVAIGFLGLALLARAARRDTLTGVALAAATLVKFVPGVVAPALWRRGDWRMPAAALATAVLLYLPYLGVGAGVFGFLGGYGAEEGFAQGDGFWPLAGLMELGPLPRFAVPLYIAGAAVVLAVLALRIGFATPQAEEGHADRGADLRRACAGAAVLGGAAMALLSPHYPWYFAWLALPACVAPLASVVWLSAAPLLLTLDPLHERFIWPSLIYVPAALLALRDLARARRPVRPDTLHRLNAAPGAFAVGRTRARERSL